MAGIVLPRGDLVASSSASTYASSLYQSEYPSSSVDQQTDEWFQTEFERLYHQVVKFVDVFFCRSHDITQRGNVGPWIEMPPEFLRYSMMVAEPDDGLGDWNRILFKGSERRHLLVGIISRILEAKVFRELLFGANIGQKKQLEGLEMSFSEVEGFSRTEARAKTINEILGNRTTPAEFDIDVARLSKQILILLRPLTKFLKQAGHREITPLSEEDQFRSIHNIVKMAASLAVRVRRSPTIFYFHSERPGNLFAPDDQIDMDYPAYVESKAAFEARHEAPAGKAMAMATQPQPHSQPQPHRALVRFALWPSIRRYSPGIGHGAAAIAGFRVYTICNSRVVYYWGPADPACRVRPDLQSFVCQQRREHRNWVLKVLDAARTVNNVASGVILRIGTTRMAVTLATAIYLIARDMQGKNGFDYNNH